MSDIPYEEIEYFRPQPGDYILAYYDLDKIPPEKCNEYHEELRKIFSDYCVISLPQDYCHVMGVNKEDTIQSVLSVLKYGLTKEEYEEVITKEFHKIVGDDLK